MTHDELTALWREAGEPGDRRVLGLRATQGSYKFVPDWSHPMTEFAMMCAAEQAAGCRLVYRREEMDDCPDYWTIETDTGEMPDCFGGSYKAPESRIECALRVIIACNKERKEQEQ